MSAASKAASSASAPVTAADRTVSTRVPDTDLSTILRHPTLKPRPGLPPAQGLTGTRVREYVGRKTISRRVAMSRSVLMTVAVLALGAGGLAAPAASAPPQKPKGPPIDHIVVIYEENHSFDNLYGRWERVNGLDDADAAHTLRSTQTAPCCRACSQNDVNLTSPPLPATCSGTVGSTAINSALREPPVRDRRLHPARRHDLPGARASFAANGVLNGTGAARRLHARPGAPLLPGAVPDRRRQAGPLRHRQ